MEALDAFKKAEKCENKMAELFKPIAINLLTGGYFVVSSENDVVRRVFPYTVEFYYHEEDGFGETKDYIVYHRNPDNPTKKPSQLTAFKVGSLNTHISGIDITFEDPEGRYRASALIRAYQVIEGDKEFPSTEGEVNPEVNRFSTYLYNNFFMGVNIEKGITVKWKDEEWAKLRCLYNGYRVNVCKYKDIEMDKPVRWCKHVKMTKNSDSSKGPIIEAKDIQDKKPWAFSRGEFSGLCNMEGGEFIIE